MPLKIIAGADDSGRRLDRVLRKALRQTPLSAIHRMLRQGLVLVDGRKAGPDRRVLAGETITAPVAEYEGTSNKQLAPNGEKNSLDLPEILFEGSGLLILNKPSGLSVHGRESIDNMVRSYLVPKLHPSLACKPGPLPRLDRPSSGVLVFSTGLEGARRFSAMMREGKIKKQYLAIVEGYVEGAEVWEDELFRDTKIKKTFTGNSGGNNSTQANGKTALTRIRALIGNKDYSLVLFEIETGRTHQIRAQAASRRHPLLGDKKYGGGLLSGGFLLHAWRLYLPPPFPSMVEAPLPENFKNKIKVFFGTDIMQLKI
jgi:23S rRNA pseudouridine955/2504/2580 synthase